MKPANKFFNLGTITTTTVSDAYELYDQVGYCVQIAASVVTPSAKSFATTDVDVADNTITEVAHGFYNNLVGQFTTTDTLPDGLSLLTNYYIIVVDANTYQVSASIDGAAVDLIDQGVGVGTFTPTALAGASYKIQATAMPPAPQNDQIERIWVDVANEGANITVDANFLVLRDISHARAIRVSSTLTAGAVAISFYINSK